MRSENTVLRGGVGKRNLKGLQRNSGRCRRNQERVGSSMGKRVRSGAGMGLGRMPGLRVPGAPTAKAGRCASSESRGLRLLTPCSLWRRTRALVAVLPASPHLPSSTFDLDSGIWAPWKDGWWPQRSSESQVGRPGWRGGADLPSVLGDLSEDSEQRRM